MEEFIKILLPAVVILTVAVVGLGLTMLVRKNGKFPDIHIHSNKYLRERDIHCVQKEDAMEQKKGRDKEKYRNMKYIKK
jgi:hypothetical protein